MKEIWKPLIYEDIKMDLYEISNYGNCRNKRTREPILQCLDDKGYPMLSLMRTDLKYSKHGNIKYNKTVRVHRVVMENFNPNKDPSRPHVLHNDNNPLNTRLDNFRWGSHKENIQQAYEDNLVPIMYGERNGMSKINSGIALYIHHLLIWYGENAATVAKKLYNEGFDLGRMFVHEIKRGSTWGHITGRVNKRKVSKLRRFNDYRKHIVRENFT